jgi:DMSO/TMAO reductase YedYZ molybdopterin-dependent catalytic subunit
MIEQAIRRGSMASLAGLALHYGAHYALGWPLLTDHLAEWIMARTPSRWAIPILDLFGEWAKPFAATGALATIGFVLFVAALSLGAAFQTRQRAGARGLGFSIGALVPGMLAGPVALPWAVGFGHAASAGTLWAGGLLALIAMTVMHPAKRVLESRSESGAAVPTRREAITKVAIPVLMSSGVVAVAVESYARNRVMAARAVQPVKLYDFDPPADTFAPDLVRPLITPVEGPKEVRFYRMSKNPVDPAIDPSVWRLKIRIQGKPWREFTYQQLLSLPRHEQYTTLRCVSNDLTTNLMGNASWSGIHLSQLIDPRVIPNTVKEAAVKGIDGHSDSFGWRYVFRQEVMLALGMNGKTLNRDHGFPLRMIAPRYYGFKHIKWIDEIDFTDQPYFGYWPKVYNFTKEPLVHTYSRIDKVLERNGRLVAGGFSFAGDRGIRRVEVRVNEGAWGAAVLESRLSPYTWVRWYATLPVMEKGLIEARAMDGEGRWQSTEVTPLIPNGVDGPTQLWYPS